MPPLLIDNLPAINIADIRRSFGGRRRFKKLAPAGIRIQLPDGKEFIVSTISKPSTLGGEIIYFSCPTCDRPCRTMRITLESLMCYRCLQGQLGAKFASQLPKRRLQNWFYSEEAKKESVLY